MEQCGLLDENLFYCFDQEYWARFVCAGYQPLVLEKPLSIEREHIQRKSATQDEKYLLERIYVAHKHMNKLSAKDCKAVRASIRRFERRIIRQPLYKLADLSKQEALINLFYNLIFNSDLLQDRETWGLLRSLIMG